MPAGATEQGARKLDELEEAPPGQAIVRRGAEMVTVMTPLLASAALEQHLARVRFGSVELTGLEKQVLQAARELAQGGKKISTRAVQEALGGSHNPIVAACRRLRQLGPIVGNKVAEEIADNGATKEIADSEEASLSFGTG